MNTLKTLLGGIALSSFMALPVAADCSVLDTTGHWKLYVSNSGGPDWIACDVGVFFGQISTGSCMPFNAPDPPFFAFRVLDSGELIVTKECDVSGHFIFAHPPDTFGSVVFTVRGKMDATRSTIYGAGHSNINSAVTFTAMKE